MEESPQPKQPPEELTRHERRAAKKEEAARTLNRSLAAMRARRWGIGVGILALAALAVWGIGRAAAPALREAGSVLNACVNHGGGISMHIHPHLRIVVNGEERLIPRDIGTSPCMRPLHTHDDTGKIHVEYFAPREFVLDEFFRVWGQPFTREAILDARVDETHEIVVTVGGERVDTFETTPISDGANIVIEYRTKE